MQDLLSRRLASASAGQGLSEYALILGLVVVAGVGGLLLLVPVVSNLLSGVVSGL